MQNIILIDNDSTSNYINELLISSISKNITLTTFTNPLDLVASINDLHISERTLVLLDLNMPQMNGWDLLSYFENLGMSCQIVILTSSSNMIETENAKKFKFVKKILTKPLKKDDISELIS